VVGHAVNLAARIETFTVGGQILMSLASRQLAGDRVAVTGPFQAYGKGVEGPIELWEVRGLPQEPGMVLPPTVPGLAGLVQPAVVQFRLISGKQIAPELYQARMTRLSQAGAALEPDLKLEDFAALQLELRDPAGQAIHLDGKVVSAAGREYIIRFSPLSEAGETAVAALLTAGAKPGAGSREP
jgi:adenylate cyclase